MPDYSQMTDELLNVEVAKVLGLYKLEAPVNGRIWKSKITNALYESIPDFITTAELYMPLLEAIRRTEAITIDTLTDGTWQFMVVDIPGNKVIQTIGSFGRATCEAYVRWVKYHVAKSPKI